MKLRFSIFLLVLIVFTSCSDATSGGSESVDEIYEFLTGTWQSFHLGDPVTYVFTSDREYYTIYLGVKNPVDNFRITKDGDRIRMSGNLENDGEIYDMGFMIIVDENNVTFNDVVHLKRIIFTVNPDRYLSFEAGSVVIERGTKETVTLFYGPSDLMISFSPSSASAMLVDRDPDDPSKIIITGLEEGNFNLTASTEGGLVDNISVQVKVTRTLTVSDRTSIYIEPNQNSPTRTFVVYPADETNEIILSLADNDIATVVKPTDNSFYILGKKEGLTDVILTDKRSGRNQTIRVPVSVEFPSIDNLISGDDDIYRAEASGQYNARWYAEETLSIIVDPRVNVTSFQWINIPATGWIARNYGGGGNAGIKVTEANDAARTIFVGWHNDEGANFIDDVGRFTGTIQFRITYGPSGGKTYNGSIEISGSAF